MMVRIIHLKGFLRFHGLTGKSTESASQAERRMALTLLPTTLSTVLKLSVRRSTPATTAIPSNGNPAADKTVAIVTNAEPGIPGVLNDTNRLLSAIASNNDEVRGMS